MQKMKQNNYPLGWDEKRVKDVINYCDQQTEAEAALQNELSTLMAIPTELVPAVLELIDKHTTKAHHNV